MVFVAPLDLSDVDAEELFESDADDTDDAEDAEDNAVCVSHAPAAPNGNSSRVVCSYFVVSRVDVSTVGADLLPGRFRIDPDITRVITEGVVCRRVPFAIETFLACSPATALPPGVCGESLPGSPPLPLEFTAVVATYGVCPTVWAPAVTQLGALFLPSLLNQSVAVPPIALLTAPQRSGKRLLVAMTARMLGIHVIEVNAYNLLGQSERDTELKVRNLLQAAVSAAPCVLHVRRYHAFKVRDICALHSLCVRVIASTFAEIPYFCVCVFIRSTHVPHNSPTALVLGLGCARC